MFFHQALLFVMNSLRIELWFQVNSSCSTLGSLFLGSLGFLEAAFFFFASFWVVVFDSPYHHLNYHYQLPHPWPSRQPGHTVLVAQMVPSNWRQHQSFPRSSEPEQCRAVHSIDGILIWKMKYMYIIPMLDLSLQVYTLTPTSKKQSNTHGLLEHTHTYQ
jgi:hypothetical protein